MKGAFLSEPCPTCGVPRGEACKTAGDVSLDGAVHRARRALWALPGGNESRSRSSLADVEAIRAGRLTVQEESLRGDELDAWRIAVACACLARVQGERARPVVRAVLALCPRPFVALQHARHGSKLLDLLSPLGLARVRSNAIARLSIAELDSRSVEAEAPAYTRDSIRLFVVRDLSFVPDDKVLRAARARMFALSRPHLAETAPRPP